MTRLTLILLALLALPAWASPAPLSAEEQLAGAEQAMDDASRALADDPELAEHLYEEAAARYRSLIETRGIESSALHRAEGNARLLAGDVGRAIACYRRAERLDPRDERTRQSLAHARALVRTSVTPGLEERALRTALWWRGIVPRSWMFAAFAVAFGGVWAVELARLVLRRRPGHAWAAACAVVAAVTLGSLVVEHVAFRMVEHAVVVDRSVAARTGPSDEVYPPAFETPLSAGVEGVVTVRRDGWARLRLADGRDAWVPAGSIETIGGASGAR